MTDGANRFIAYPLYPPPPSLLERAMRRLNFGGAARCTVCGKLTLITGIGENLRETCWCARCGSCNRQRQLAYVVCRGRGASWGRRVSSLKDLAGFDDCVLYNTESSGAVHDALSGMKRYLCSEWFGDGHASGEMVRGVMHQDLMHLSLDDESVSLMLSSDVFEHIADPYRAHGEAYRVLRKGGRHVFTVPFLQEEYRDEELARIDDAGKRVFAGAPQYHGDPLRAEGALVYRIFSLEMLVRLRAIGFRTNMYHLRKRFCGVFGSNGLVFEAIKS